MSNVCVWLCPHAAAASMTCSSSSSPAVDDQYGVRMFDACSARLECSSRCALCLIEDIDAMQNRPAQIGEDLVSYHVALHK